MGYVGVLPVQYLAWNSVQESGFFVVTIPIAIAIPNFMILGGVGYTLVIWCFCWWQDNSYSYIWVHIVVVILTWCVVGPNVLVVIAILWQMRILLLI